jgi:hypothetical protein
MRSRNIQFSASNVKPSTQFYQFLDGNSGVDFIPKLIEITNTSGAFVVGETVIGTFGGNNLITFRVASQIISMVHIMHHLLHIQLIHTLEPNL